MAFLSPNCSMVAIKCSKTSFCLHVGDGDFAFGAEGRSTQRRGRVEFCFNHRHGTEYPSMEVATTVKMLSGKTLCGEDLGRVSVVEMGNRVGCGLT